MSDENQTDERKAQLTRVRRNSLLLKWSRAGRLSKSEFEEVRDELPPDAVERLEAQFKQEGAAASDPTTDIDGRVHYQKPLIEYEKLYGRKVRQLKNLIKIGKAATPPELPPFDNPADMARWWAAPGHMKQRVPKKLLDLAATWRLDSSQGGESIDVTQLTGGARDMVRQARAYLEAADKHLLTAYAGGNDARIEICQRRWLRAAKAVKEAEASAREDAKIAGDLIPKSELFPELSQLLETLRHMRSTRRRRTDARIKDVDLTPAQREQIGEAVDNTLEEEDAVLRRLPQFRNTQEIDAFQLEYAGDK